MEILLFFFLVMPVVGIISLYFDNKYIENQVKKDRDNSVKLVFPDTNQVMYYYKDFYKKDKEILKNLGWVEVNESRN